MNRELMEKIASRKWKEMIGTLSPENEKRLVKANILNYHREAKGLNEGSRRLASKWNIKINSDGKDTRVDRARKMLSQKYYDPITSKAADFAKRRYTDGGYEFLFPGGSSKFHRRLIDTGSFDKGIKDDIELIMRRKGKRRVVGPQGKFYQGYNSLGSDTLVSKNGTVSGIVNANPDYFNMIKDTPEKIKKNSSLKYQTNAIGLRHEIDEAITMMKQRKNNNVSAVTGKYKSHTAPSIIFKESANVSALHPAVRDFYSGKRAQGKFPESNMLKAFGVDYGKSGKFNRAAANRADKDYYAFRRENH